MKNTVRISAILLTLLLLLPLFAVPAFAADEKKETYEMVLLIDVSGSMKESDPQKLSMDFAEIFAAYRPSYNDMFLSVVVFNSNTAVAVERVNVSTEDGMAKYTAAIEEIRNDTFKGIDCWNGMTNTGAAMEAAEKILQKSSADHKAVLLFADGKTEVSGGYDPTQQSIAKAKTVAKNLGEAGSYIYCVGLDITGTNVDKDFLKDLSASGKEGSVSKVCSNASDAKQLFDNVFANFMSGKIEDPEPPIVLQPNVPTDAKANIYGEAIKEANLVLFSDTPISHFSVTAPNGTVVVDIIEDPENPASNKSEIKKDLCMINKTSNNQIINVKLIRPMDGEWKISMTSKSAGQVTLSKIYLYDLALKTDIGENRQVGVGDKFAFSTKLYNNDTKKDVTTAALYESSSLNVDITAPDGTVSSHPAQLNGAKNGFTFNTSFTSVGTYKIRCTIKNDQFEETVLETVQVVAVMPVLSVSKTEVATGESLDVKLSFKSSTGGQMISALPDYLEDFVMTVDVKCDGTTVDTLTIPRAAFDGGMATVSYTPTKSGAYTISGALTCSGGSYTAEIASGSFTVGVAYTVGLVGPTGEQSCKDGASVSVVFKSPAGDVLTSLPAGYETANAVLEIKLGDQILKTVTLTAADFASGRASYLFMPEKAGVYKFKATVTANGETLVTEEIGVTFSAPAITVNGTLKDITASNFDGSASAEYDISDLFVSADGNKLTIKVEASDKDNVSAVLDGNTLKVTVTGFTSSVVTVTATDAYGASASCEVKVEVKSMVGLVIGLVIGAVVLLIAAVVLLIVANKRKIPHMAFNVKITDNESYSSAVYSVANLSRKRNAKPKMSLSRILQDSTFSNMLTGEMDGALLDEFIISEAAKINVSGPVFGKGLVIVAANKKRNFAGKSPVTVTVGNFSVAFGKASAFMDEY